MGAVRAPDRGNPKRHSMVDWYNPMQLIRTGFEVAVSTLFGRHADYRLLEALAAPKDRRPDEPPSSNGKDFWIDYVADLGDGWNPTYAVACAVAQPELRLRCPDGKSHVTERGSVLIFGGDVVYPVAGRTQYKERIVAPYEAALRETQAPHPLVRAIPGNHDWYDSLVSFMRLFSTREFFAGWRAKQVSSYFAIKLPRGWWLLGTDVQLDSDIDQPQVDYFKSIAERILPGERIILCNAEPHWIYAHIYGKMDPDYNENNLAFLEKIILKDKTVAVFLAGDLHHYRRHAKKDGTQRITAGGGGAFLHPTHGPDVSEIGGGYKLQGAFPREKECRKLCWRNLMFLAWNPWFGAVPGILYMLTAWAVLTDLSMYGIGEFASALSSSINAALNHPVAAFWMTLLVAGFFLFTDTHSKRYRFVAGSVHALVHLFAVFLIGWAVTFVTVRYFNLDFSSTGQLLAAGALIILAGWVVGSFIMGIYLLVSLNVFGRHAHEAFSSLKIQDWKNFLRMKIDARGNLTIYPIGIRRVPRKWIRRPEGEPGSEWTAADPKATEPELIEAPFGITPQTR